MESAVGKPIGKFVLYKSHLIFKRLAIHRELISQIIFL